MLFIIYDFIDLLFGIISEIVLVIIL